MTGNSSNDPTHSGPPRSDADWEALARYYAGESTDAEAAAILAWLAANPAEAARFETIEAGIQQLSADQHGGIDVETALQRVAARRDEGSPAKPRLVPSPASERAVRTPAAPPRATAPRGWRIPALAAAAVGAVALGTLVWRSKTTTAPAPAPVTAAARDVTTGVGQRDSIRLADGSRVLLGPMSHLRVSPGYGESARTVELQGEGWFDVRHDDALPFVVRSGAAVIRDVGTTFTVEASDTNQVRVVVTSGSVHLAKTTDSSGVLLQAGDVGQIRPGQGPVVTRKAASDADLAWTRGQLAFRNAPLATVADELKRWYGLELVFADSSLRGRTLNTTFVRESREQALRIIELTLGVRIEMRGDTAIMHRSMGGARR